MLVCQKSIWNEILMIFDWLPSVILVIILWAFWKDDSQLRLEMFLVQISSNNYSKRIIIFKKCFWEFLSYLSKINGIILLTHQLIFISALHNTMHLSMLIMPPASALKAGLVVVLLGFRLGWVKPFIPWVILESANIIKNRKSKFLNPWLGFELLSFHLP